MLNTKQVLEKEPWIPLCKVVTLSTWHNPVSASYLRHLHSTYAFPDTHSHLKREYGSVDAWESWWRSWELLLHRLVQTSWEQLASLRWAAVHMLAVMMRHPCSLYMPEELLWDISGNCFLAGCGDTECCSELDENLPQQTLSKISFGFSWRGGGKKKRTSICIWFHRYDFTKVDLWFFFSFKLIYC